MGEACRLDRPQRTSSPLVVHRQDQSGGGHTKRLPREIEELLSSKRWEFAPVGEETTRSSRGRKIMGLSLVYELATMVTLLLTDL